MPAPAPAHRSSPRGRSRARHRRSRRSRFPAAASPASRARRVRPGRDRSGSGDPRGTAQNPQRASASIASMAERTFIKFTFIKLDPAWRTAQRPRTAGRRTNASSLAACDDFAEDQPAARLFDWSARAAIATSCWCSTERRRSRADPRVPRACSRRAASPSALDIPVLVPCDDEAVSLLGVGGPAASCSPRSDSRYAFIYPM